MTDQLGPIDPAPIPEPAAVPQVEAPAPVSDVVPEDLNLDYDPTAGDGEEDIELDLDLPEIYVPPEPVKQHIVEDKMETSIKYCFVGVGQGAGRIVQAFHKLGYNRILAVNTSVQDLKGLNLPNEMKLALNSSGSGANRTIGREFIVDGSEQIIAKARQCFGDVFDRVIVVSALGGGCVDKGTKVFTDKHGFINIEDLWDYAKSKGAVEGVEATMSTCGDAIIDIRPLGLRTYSLDSKTGKTVMSIVEQVRRVNVSPDCRTDVHLSNGALTTVSDWHPYFVLDKGVDGIAKVIETKASDLKLGDLVYTPEISPVKEDTPDTDLAWLAGVIAGDGHFPDPYTIQLTSQDFELFDKCKAAVLRNWPDHKGKFSVTDKPNNKANRFNMYGKTLVATVASLIGGFATHKIHTWIIDSKLQTNMAMGEAFLAGLFDADGYMMINKKYNSGWIGIALANKQAIHQVGRLLSLRGIRFSIREKQPKEAHWSVMFELSILASTNLKFINTVGRYISCKRKIKILRQIAKPDAHKKIPGLKFEFFEGLINRLKLPKPVGNRACLESFKLYGGDFTGWVYGMHGVTDYTVAKLISGIQSRLDCLDHLDIAGTPVMRLCRLAGITKSKLCYITGFGSHRCHNMYTNNVCDSEARLKLESYVRTWIDSLPIIEMSRSLKLVLDGINVVSAVTKVEKISSYSQFYDLSIKGTSSYCASKTANLCFTHNTGSGGAIPMVGLMNDLVESMGIKSANDELTRVGMMVALPSNSEADRMKNAYDAMQEIDELVTNKVVSPVVIIDNNRNDLLMRNVSVAERWHRANLSVASMFNLFNHISIQPTNHIAFDGADYASVMDSGYITLGAMVLEGFSKEVLAAAFRENLKGTVLCAGLDFSTAKTAACVILGKSDVWKTVSQGDIDFAYESLARVIKEGAILHRGIYSTKQPLSVYTVVGGLDLPADRMAEIAKLAGI